MHLFFGILIKVHDGQTSGHVIHCCDSGQINFSKCALSPHEYPTKGVPDHGRTHRTDHRPLGSVLDWGQRTDPQEAHRLWDTCWPSSGCGRPESEELVDRLGEEGGTGPSEHLPSSSRSGKAGGGLSAEDRPGGVDPVISAAAKCCT